MGRFSNFPQEWSDPEEHWEWRQVTPDHQLGPRMQEPTVWYLHVGAPDLTNPETCPACGFDSVYTFPILAMSITGVAPWSTVLACVRCAPTEEP